MLACGQLDGSWTVVVSVVRKLGRQDTRRAVLESLSWAEDRPRKSDASLCVMKGGENGKISNEIMHCMMMFYVR